MSDLSMTLASVQYKVEKLVHLHRKLKEEQLKLEIYNNDLLETIDKQSKTIAQLQENIVTIKLSNTIKEGSEKSDISLKINELVRGINKCITLLNR